MKYSGSAVTDIGLRKKTNQDSACLKIAETKRHGQVAMGVICDGMGGLERGELASATVIRAFESWFERQLPEKINNYTWEGLSADWERMIRGCNDKILKYGQKYAVRLGTTVSALLLMEGRYLIAHVGDSRIYRISDSIEQLTEDQSYVAREIKRGNLTWNQAKENPKRNVLLQCVGASDRVSPDILLGKGKEETVYVLCSDGFWRELSEKEISVSFRPADAVSAEEMEKRSRRLMERAKQRDEGDNLSVVLIKCGKQEEG